MAGGAEQAGGLLDSVAPQYFNQPARNFKERVVDTAGQCGEDDGEDDGAGRADDGEDGEPKANKSTDSFEVHARPDKGAPAGRRWTHILVRTRRRSVPLSELRPVALERARTARALGSSVLARSHSREPRAAVGWRGELGKVDGLKSILSIGSKNPELY